MECPYCHQAIEAPEGEELSLVDCPACGSQSLPDAAYCHKCGQKLSGEEDNQADPPLCPSCGKAAQPDDS